ncbi:MAG: hypothetical protein EOO24_44775 [Comamonadaceae bacterium]|nr:MAG: hypothetical protein EOO24_44775 [Comamonadaceae bacterium]
MPIPNTGSTWPRVDAGPTLDDRARSLSVARMMLRGAVALFREELRKGACEERVAEARTAMVYWRERLRSLTLDVR